MAKLRRGSRATVNDSLTQLMSLIDTAENSLDLTNIERSRQILEIGGTTDIPENMHTNAITNTTPKYETNHNKPTSPPKEVQNTDVSISEVSPTSSISKEVKGDERDITHDRTRIHFTRGGSVLTQGNRKIRQW